MNHKPLTLHDRYGTIWVETPTAPSMFVAENYPHPYDISYLHKYYGPLTAQTTK